MSSNFREDVEKWKLLYTASRNVIDITLWKEIWQYLGHLNIFIS